MKIINKVACKSLFISVAILTSVGAHAQSAELCAQAVIHPNAQTPTFWVKALNSQTNDEVGGIEMVFPYQNGFGCSLWNPLSVPVNVVGAGLTCGTIPPGPQNVIVTFVFGPSGPTSCSL